MKNIGRIEIITGCMFAGKTEELIRKVNTLMRTNHEVIVVKSAIDDRYGLGEVISHNGNRIKAINVHNAREILKEITDDTNTICVDEVQFLGPEVVRVIEHLAKNGINVVASGLDMDFRGEPFTVMSDLLARATNVTKLTSFCATCGADATMTQRLVNGEAASYYDPIILVGATDSYEPRCRGCHEIKDEPIYF